jgi:hypothetical protein
MPIGCTIPVKAAEPCCNTPAAAPLYQHMWQSIVGCKEMLTTTLGPSHHQWAQLSRCATAARPPHPAWGSYQLQMRSYNDVLGGRGSPAAASTPLGARAHTQPVPTQEGNT